MSTLSAPSTSPTLPAPSADPTLPARRRIVLWPEPRWAGWILWYSRWPRRLPPPTRRGPDLRGRVASPGRRHPGPRPFCDSRDRAAEVGWARRGECDELAVAVRAGLRAGRGRRGGAGRRPELPRRLRAHHPGDRQLADV